MHLTRDDLPGMRKKAPLQQGNFNKFMFRFKQAMKFPGLAWFGLAWKVVARMFRAKGEGKWVDMVEKNVLDPSKSGAGGFVWDNPHIPTHSKEATHSSGESSGSFSRARNLARSSQRHSPYWWMQ